MVRQVQPKVILPLCPQGCRDKGWGGRQRVRSQDLVGQRLEAGEIDKGLREPHTAYVQTPMR